LIVGADGVDGAAVVGLIADTHGLLRLEALEALKGVNIIIHAGDVGRAEILEMLKGLAPVRAVRGNVDCGAWAKELPKDELVEVGEIGIYVYHGHEELGLDPKAAGYQVVVSGHSHKPATTEKKGVLYLNPGSAGPKRFRLPVTVMRLYIAGKYLRPELVQLV
jgi:putative phosphoesterase